jgi:hypothetical protein
MEDGHQWPHGVIACGSSVLDILGRLGRTPSWVIVDGGALHGTTTQAFASRRLKMWAVRGAVSAWGLHVDGEDMLMRHGTMGGFGRVVDKHMQRGLAKAYGAVGGARFKPGMVDDEFREDKILEAMRGVPTEIWGEDLGRADWEFQRKYEWPDATLPWARGRPTRK